MSGLKWGFDFGCKLSLFREKKVKFAVAVIEIYWGFKFSAF